MGRRSGTWNALSKVIFLAVFAVSVGVFYLTRTGGGYIDFFINLVFDAVALVFLIIYFAGCARPLTRVTGALSRMTDAVRSAGEDPKALWNRFGREGIFGERRLDERYGAYVREARRQQRRNSLTADVSIEDYIDEDLIYAAVNKSFCDQLSGIMSGLGILFTFIGLVYGLRNFDASSVDVMQTSTQALMAGIKVAFLTSIFGLIYSLLFGLTYKKLLGYGLQALYGFQDAFAECVRPSNEHAAQDAMLRLQTEQNAALERFGSSVGEQVSEAVITLMGPTVDTLQSTITKYVTVAIEDQRAGMDKVVRYFLDSMNSSLGNIFGQLKDRTEDLARWETEMIAAIRTMTDDMGRTGEDLGQAQAAALQITQAMAAYTDTIRSLTDAQSGVIRDMDTLIRAYDGRRAAEAEAVRSVTDSAAAVTRGLERALAAARSTEDTAARVNAAGADSARQIAEAGRQITEAAGAVRDMAGAAASGMDDAADRLARAAGDLADSMGRSVSDSLSRLDESIARLNGAMESISGAVGGVEKTMNALPKTVIGVDTDIRSTARVIDTELKLLLKAVSDTRKLLDRFNDDLERRTGR